MRCNRLMGGVLGLLSVAIGGEAAVGQSVPAPAAAEVVKTDTELLKDLLIRRKKARESRELLEAELAVRKAETEAAELAVQLFLMQHPELTGKKESEKATDAEAIPSSLQFRLTQAEERIRALEARAPTYSSMDAEILVEQLRRWPIKRSKAENGFGLFAIDLVDGRVNLITAEAAADLNYTGSPSWSSDRKRIVFDATPGTEWNLTRLERIDAATPRPTLTDLGPGNCPSFSGDGKRIAFLLNPEAAPGAETGIWVMQSDGSGRRRLGGYGRVKWSPVGDQLLINSFSNPSETTLMDAENGQERPVQVEGKQIYSVPSWAADGSLIAVIGEDRADTIVRLDVTNPAKPSIKEVFWKRGDGIDVTPAQPIYWPSTRRCVFIGAEPKGMALYAIEPGPSRVPRRLEAGSLDEAIKDLEGSQDGRYVLFCSTRADRREPEPAGTR